MLGMNVLRATALLVALPLFTLVAQAKAPVDTSAAPADEYFGTQKMSALGLRMRIGDLGRRLHAHVLADADALHDALDLEDSYHAWDMRYPRDSWLAPTAFHLEQLYAEVQLPDGRTHALAMLKYISARFGTTKYGHLSRLRLAQGFPALREPVAVTTTPAPGAPQGVAAPADAAASPGAVASPAAVASPGATSSAMAVPAGTPSGTASGAPVNGPSTAP